MPLPPDTRYTPADSAPLDSVPVGWLVIDSAVGGFEDKPSSLASTGNSRQAHHRLGPPLSPRALLLKKSAWLPHLIGDEVRLHDY